jgi:hypothetical protein
LLGKALHFLIALLELLLDLFLSPHGRCRITEDSFGIHDADLGFRGSGVIRRQSQQSGKG